MIHHDLATTNDGEEEVKGMQYCHCQPDKAETTTDGWTDAESLTSWKPGRQVPRTKNQRQCTVSSKFFTTTDLPRTTASFAGWLVIE